MGPGERESASRYSQVRGRLTWNPRCNLPMKWSARRLTRTTTAERIEIVQRRKGGRG